MKAIMVAARTFDFLPLHSVEKIISKNEEMAILKAFFKTRNIDLCDAYVTVVFFES